MKFLKELLLENKSLPDKVGVHIVTEEQLKELFTKYLFVQCNWWSEYDHESEVAALIEVPANISEDNLVKLLELAGLGDEDLDMILSCAVLRDYNRLKEFDPGTSTHNVDGGGEGKHKINLIKLDAWVDQIKQSFGEGNDDFE